MPDEDARLTDFLGESDDGDATDVGTGEHGPDGRSAEDADRAADGDSDGGSEAAAPTAEWVPDGAACAACGAVVERRWRDDGALVCAGCMEW